MIKHWPYFIKLWIRGIFCYQQIQSPVINYDKYWEEKKATNLGNANSFQLYRAQWIANRLQENASVLDIACGDASVLMEVSKIKKIQAYGVDISEKVIHFLQGKGITAVIADLSKTDELKKLPLVDHIMALEIFEHLAAPEYLLQELKAHARRSIFLSVPNTGYIQYRLRFLLGKFPVQWRIHPGEHVRFWTWSDMKWWLKEMKIEKSSTIHGYAGIPLLNKLYPALFAKGLIIEIKTL